MLPPTWSDPLPEPRLAAVGCGTRPWEYDQKPEPGTYDLSRLAVRFETDDGPVDTIDHHVEPIEVDGNRYDDSASNFGKCFPIFTHEDLGSAFLALLPSQNLLIKLERGGIPHSIGIEIN